MGRYLYHRYDAFQITSEAWGRRFLVGQLEMRKCLRVGMESVLGRGWVMCDAGLVRKRVLAG